MGRRAIYFKRGGGTTNLHASEYAARLPRDEKPVTILPLSLKRRCIRTPDFGGHSMAPGLTRPALMPRRARARIARRITSLGIEIAAFTTRIFASPLRHALRLYMPMASISVVTYAPSQRRNFRRVIDTSAAYFPTPIDDATFRADLPTCYMPSAMPTLIIILK